MRDLTDVLGAAVDARAQALEGLAPASGLAGLRTRVRRRRAARHTLEAMAVLPVAAAIGVGGWLLLGDRDPVPPVISPSPTSTPTDDPTPDPTPTPSPTPTSEVRYLSTVTVDPLLPSAERLPEGLLAETDADWTLLRYDARPNASAGDSGVSEEYLLSPDGHRYQLPDHPGSITGWLPGSPRALAIQTSDDGSAGFGLVDLETGSWYPVDVAPVLTLRDMTGRDVTVWVQLAPNGTDLYVILEPWDEGATVSLTLLDPATGLATNPFEAPAGARSLAVSPDGTHLLAAGDGRVTVVSTTGDRQAVADLPGCTPSYAGWLSNTVWFAACAWAVPEDVDDFYAVHSLDGQVWGVPNDGVLYPSPLTATGDVVWAEVEMGSGAAVPETLLRVSSDRGVEAFTLAGPQMMQYASTASGRLIASTDSEGSDDGYWGLPAPVYMVDLDSATTSLIVPEPEGADAGVAILSGAGGAGLWHHSDGAWENTGD